MGYRNGYSIEASHSDAHDVEGLPRFIPRASIPSEGLEGRIYLYNRSGDPVKAEGQLVVYAFDESNPRDIDQVPDRRYVFTSEQLQRHYSESSIGPSYSVWLPWDGVGGPPTKVNLVPTFLPTIGQVVVGQEVRQHLPGADAHCDAITATR